MARRRERGIAFAGTAAVAALLLAAAGAHAATLTQPTDGATVSLTPSFTWTMAPNEVLSAVMSASSPSTTAPDASAACQTPDDTATSCTSGWPWDAGTWYAWVRTEDSNTGQPYTSPIVRFVVPPQIGFGPTDPWGGNPPPTVRLDRVKGDPARLGSKVYVSPFASVQTSGWLNDPGARITVTYVVRYGRRVLQRATNIEKAGGEEDWGFSGDVFFVIHQRRAPPRARLRCTITLRGDGVSASDTVTMRNPPPGGKVVKAPH